MTIRNSKPIILFVKKHLLHWSLWTILLLECVYIFLILLNYDLTWVNPEKFWTHAWILENGSRLHWQDISRSFNINVIEMNPDRLSRPISNFVEVIDTKFRANCWQFMPPHPSLSLLWPVLFIALPVFLYKFLINMGCEFPIALSGVCLYLSSIGFLGPIIMLFHPAKGLVNFMAVLSLWAGSWLYKKTSSFEKKCSAKDIPHFWKHFLLLLGVMFLGFFCDETGLFMYLVVGVVLYPVFKKVKEKGVLLAGYLVLPVLYFISLRGVLPYVHLIINGHAVNVSHYESYPHLHTLFFPNVHNLLTNLCWLFSDYPHLMLSFRNVISSGPYFFLQLAYSLIFALIVFLFLKKNHSSPGDSWVKKVGLFSGVLIAYGFFQTFQLSANAFVWGVWWYGSLFSLVYFIAFSFVLQKVWSDQNKTFQKFFVLIIFIFVLEGLIFTTYRINIFKIQNHDRNNYPYREIFNGNINPYIHFNFSESLTKAQCKQIYTTLQWASLKHRAQPRINLSQITQCQEIMKNDIYFPIQMLYLPVELQPKGDKKD